MNKEKKTAPSQGNISVGHPVNVATGVLYHEFDDCELSGRIPLVFQRRYSTALLDQEPGMFGLGWHCPLELKINRDLDGYSLTDLSGEATLVFNITHGRLEAGEVAQNLGAFCELRLKDQELCVTRWNVDSGDISHDFFPLPQGDEWTSISRREDAEGNTLLFAYNKDQQLTEITQQREQCSLTLEYDDQGRLITVYRVVSGIEDEQQDKQPFLQYAYNDQGQLAKFTDPLGASSYYKYDDSHRMIYESTLSGLVYTFQFNQEGRCVYLSGDNDFDLQRIEYNELARMSEVTNSQGHTSIYQWNESNQVEKVISPSGNTEATSYDDDGRIIGEFTPSGTATLYAYDDKGNRCSITSPDGATVQYIFNEHHQVINIIDPLNNQWLREYDEQGRLLSQTNPLEVKQQFIYNSQGDLLEQKDGAGNIRKYQWDSHGRLTSATDWEDHSSSYTWDQFGDLTAYTDAAGFVTQMSRDRVGHLLVLTLPDGNQRKYQWGVYDDLENYADENKVVTEWEYCACGSVQQEIKPDGSKIIYDWSAVPGQLSSLTNEKGELYQFTYDEEGELTEETDFSGATTQYEYDQDGQVIKTKKPSGHITCYQYDEAGRVTEVLYDDDTGISYEYDSRGLLTKADNNDCPVTFEYDLLGRMIRETQGEQFVEHEYDKLNNRILRKSALGDKTEFEWNANGQIAQVQTVGFDPVNFEYDERGYESKRQLGHNMAFEQQIDQRGRLVQQTLNHKTSHTPCLLQRQYQYDPVSNLLSKQDSKWGITQYTYDVLERIETTLHPDQVLERFSYDVNSNITNYQQHTVKPETNLQDILSNKSDWQYEQGDKLVKREGVQYEYDKDGQLIAQTDSKGTTRYIWNRSGQLVSIQKQDESEWFYRYDALSRRVEKRGSSIHIEYVWDGDVILYEINQFNIDNAEKKVHSWEYHPHDFSPLYKLEDCQKQYFSINDQAGTPLLLVDSNGFVAWNARLKTFGTITQVDNRIDCPIRFQGQWHDQESKLHYNRFRYYDADRGLYISKDPIGLLASLNVYLYVYNPNGWIDPLGLTRRCIAGGRSKRRRLKKIIDNVLSRRSRNEFTVFRNKDKTLPTHNNGHPILYTEHDYNPRPTAIQREHGADRGKLRVVIGDDGRAYYTNDHYKSFVRVR